MFTVQVFNYIVIYPLILFIILSFKLGLYYTALKSKLTSQHLLLFMPYMLLRLVQSSNSLLKPFPLSLSISTTPWPFSFYNLISNNYYTY